MAFTYAQLEQLWIQNGGNAALAPIAAAIALAESSGNPNSTNPTDNGGRQTSWGLWQISNGTHAQPVPNILDPNINAQQAIAKYNGAVKAGRNGWSPWGTYNTGAYKRYLQNNVPPDANGVPAGGPGSTVGGAVIGAAGAGIGGAVNGSTNAVDVSATSGSGSGGSGSTCLLGYNGVFGTSVGSFCVISKTETRALLGGLLMVLGAVTALVGVVLVVKGSVPNPITQPTVNVNVSVPKDKEKPAPEEKEEKPAPKAREPINATGRLVTPGRPSPRTVHMLNKPRTLSLPGGK